MSIITKLLSSDECIVVNKTLARKLGWDAAILIAELCSEYEYFSKTQQLTDDEFFYCTIPYIEEATGLSEYNQRKVIALLKEKGIVEVDLRQMPETDIRKMRYIKLHVEAIMDIFEEEVHPPKIQRVPTENLTGTHQKFSPNNINNINTRINTHINTINNKTRNNNVITRMESEDSTLSSKSNSSPFNAKLNTSVTMKKEKKKTKEEKVGEALVKHVYDVETDADIQELLSKWVLSLVSIDKALSIQGFDIAYEELKRLSKGDKQKQIKMIKDAIQLGYRKFEWVTQNNNDKKYNGVDHLHHGAKIVPKDQLVLDLSGDAF